MNKIKLLLVIVAVFTLFLSATSSAESVTGKEYQAVVDTAYNYFNGAANGNQKLLSKAFDLEFGHVKMINVDKKTGKETIRTVPLKEFSGYFKKATKDIWSANILSVDIVDDKMAMVKLDFDTPKTHYIDYLVMYKRENEWRIINKTFVATKK
ncbi:nuclear transport factor 2 family protein [Thalassotalea sp. M1531]|uniref:Nuclear transport factor 2 family protein n=1 Tax=Thalassotalea algicola TaxID=2716224 RepID=A0A7Y0LB84_9GAMM|nr:nuclear transport factor 2 family protein [Thalassotalea algicola]NMP31348.1 nuclear transport factor 2 family protein [Thalassotalea algicola]